MDVQPETMRETDLDSVLELERESFATPWTRANFLHEVRDNPFAWNLVLRDGLRLVAFASSWIVDDELRVNSLAVAISDRRKGIGKRFLAWILTAAAERGCQRAVLEVRPSNLAARKLYEAFGFRQIGVRKRYYQENGEDALVLEVALPPVAAP